MSRVFLNDGWLFSEGFKNEYLSGETDASFSKIRIPHTVHVTPYNYFSEQEYQMISTYRKIINAPKAWAQKRVLITFDGAAHYAEVYLNGERIGEHYSGYTAFTLELTDKFILGKDNILIIKLDSRESLDIPPFGKVIDYMTYGGIYRDVYLDIKEQIYLSDVFVKPEMTGKIASEVRVIGEIPDGTYIEQYATLSDESFYIGKKGVFTGEAEIHGFIKDVKLWRLDSPTLYEIKTELYTDGKLMDTHTAKVGFRKAEFKKDGFYLNGRKTRIRGLNRHQSYPYVGYAMPESMQKLDADVLKNELGLNAVRTSHYPQSHHFIDRCDELGLLVFTEIPGWQYIGGEEWKEQAIRNVEEMILQYRNHPSIVIWGVRINESRDDHELYVKTNELAHRLDPTRQTGGVRNFKRSELLEDVYTYNDFLHDGINPGCEPKEKVTSNKEKPYLVTENNGHMFPTKSFDCEDHRTEHALRHARVLDAVASHDDICGSFSWCAFDYNTHKDFGSGDRICYHGVMDMFRNPKLAAAVFASQSEGEPVLEVSSSMDIGEHPASVKGGVWIFSNADSVKMYKNGRFIKEFPTKNKHFPNLPHSPILVDDYVGELLVTDEGFSEKKAACVAAALNYIGMNGYTQFTRKLIKMAVKCIVLYRMSIGNIVDLYTKYVGDWGEKSTVYRFDAIKDGKVVKSVTKTPMEKMRLEVKCSSTTLCEKNSYDVAALRISALDENGNLLPYSSEPVKITVKGALELIGPDMTSLRGGVCGFYVKTTGKQGAATVTLSCPQTEEVKIEFEIV